MLSEGDDDDGPLTLEFKESHTKSCHPVQAAVDLAR
jgi:hypothetical protein